MFYKIIECSGCFGDDLWNMWLPRQWFMNNDSQVGVLIRYIKGTIVKYVVCQGSCAAYNSTFANMKLKLPGICPFR